MHAWFSLALVHFLRGPDEIFPCIRATTRAGHDVVEVALVRVQQAAGALAAVAVALANGLGTELWAFFRHLGKVHRHDNGRHTDGTACGAHGVVTGANRQRDPLVPSDGPECFRTGTIAKLDVERGGGVRGQRDVRSIGVTNRIRTGTNAFTGRDAAVTS
jgi:hypothetical protein